MFKHLKFVGFAFFMSFYANAADSVLSENSNKAVQDHQQDTNESAVLLAKILANTLTYKAEFKQSVFREDSDIPEVTTGSFLIQRPSHFKWQTNSPFEQMIVADGTSLWTYDPELEQATIQNQHSVLADSPLLLLTSSVESLTKAFEIIEIESRNNESIDNDSASNIDTQMSKHLFSLMPKENSLFKSIHILIEAKKIKEFFLTDTLGGRTSVEFSDIELNEKIDARQFIFVPPKDIDIIDSREYVPDQS